MKKILVVLLALSICLGLGEVSFASSIDEVIQKRDDLKEEINDLYNEANEISEDYQKYNKRYKELQSEVTKTEGNIKKNEEDIASINKELDTITKNRDEQYQLMKKRIAFTYENHNKPFIIILLESKSFSDFINKIEFITSLLEYDQSIIDEFERINVELSEKENELNEKQEQLNSDLATVADAKNEMKKLADEAGDALDAKNDEINVAMLTLEEFNAEIERLRQKEREIANANAAAIAAQMEEIQRQIENNEVEEENNSGAVNAGEDELVLLAATIQAEADGEGYEGRLGVASVIMNRVNSSLFPGTISGVIYQNKQFSCVNYTLPLILERGPNEGCMTVAREAIAGARNTSALFFMTPEAAARLGQSGTPLGNGGHVFFDVWQR